MNKIWIVSRHSRTNVNSTAPKLSDGLTVAGQFAQFYLTRDAAVAAANNLAKQYTSLDVFVFESTDVFKVPNLPVEQVRL